MKIYSKIFAVLGALICMVSIASEAQGVRKNVDTLKMHMEALNNRIEQSYMKENVDSLMSFYAEDFTFFPEYASGIFDSKVLHEFFVDWFQSGDISRYRKTIHTLEVYGDHVLEIGTFNLQYSSKQHNRQGEYKGKYMNMWKRDEKGKLKILSESSGADSYIEPEAVPYAGVEIKKSNVATRQKKINRQLQEEIEAFDRVLLRAVADGDGDTRAKGFTDDAILMGNFDSIRVGMKSIRPKLLATYSPGSTYLVTHTYSSIIDLGDYVFANGHYKGGPADPKNGGPFEGKMSNLLKRNGQGKLLMHRQLGNRNSKQN